jgi:hypothetical protein
MADFRNGSKADVMLLNFNVRFTPESGGNVRFVPKADKVRRKLVMIRS